jgi:hypothetical protein
MEHATFLVDRQKTQKRQRHGYSSATVIFGIERAAGRDGAAWAACRQHRHERYCLPGLTP